MTDRSRPPRSADRDERAIIRVTRDKAHPYTIVNNTALRDPRLSWPAKGIIGYLLTMPDDWQVMMRHLVQQSSCGRDATYSGLRELEDVGYIRRTRVRDARGRIARLEYVVFEVPQPIPPAAPAAAERPHTEKPDVDEPVDTEASCPRPAFPYLACPDTACPDTENPPLLITDRNQETKSNNTRPVPGSGSGTVHTGARDPCGAGAAVTADDPEPAGSRPVTAAPEPAPAVPAQGVAPWASPLPERGSVAAPEAALAVPEPVAPQQADHLVAASEQAPVVPEPDQPDAPMDSVAVCAAYRAVTGLDDLRPEAIDAVVRHRSLTAAYVAAKLDLLRAALAVRTVRNPRGFLVAALQRDWTPETAPQASHAADDADPVAAPEIRRLVAGLVAVGVTSAAAERWAREDPGETGRQLAWLSDRAAKDPAAVVVSAIREHWPEPASARERRLGDARIQEQDRWSAEQDRVRDQSLTPEARQRGLDAIARIRAQMERRTSVPTA